MNKIFTVLKYTSDVKFLRIHFFNSWSRNLFSEHVKIPFLLDREWPPSVKVLVNVVGNVKIIGHNMSRIKKTSFLQIISYVSWIITISIKIDHFL